MEEIRTGLASQGAEIEEFLTYQISLTARLIDRLTNKYLTLRHGISILEWHILSQIAIETPMTIFYLAERTRFDKGTVSRAAAALVERGLLSRTEDPRDRRSWLLRHTEAGRLLYNEVFLTRKALQEELSGILSEEELQTLTSATAKIRRHVSQMRIFEVGEPANGGRD